MALNLPALPCPFCGKPASVFENAKSWQIMCLAPGCDVMPCAVDDTAIGVLAKWNRRAS